MAQYRLPFKAGSWTDSQGVAQSNPFSGNMGHGNWDDAGGGHGTGQPFAWDFGYGHDYDNIPSLVGPDVIAARAGTVIDARFNFSGWIDRDGVAHGPNLNEYGNEERTLTITTAATTTNNATVTIEGHAVVVSMAGATGSTVNTAAAIAAASYSSVGSGWTAHHDAGASTVRFSCLTVNHNRTSANENGSWSFSHSTAAGTFAITDPLDSDGYPSGWRWGPGNYVIIQHADLTIAAYDHLAFMSSPPVSVGQYVNQGALIAKAGNTGASWGPHLHFECHVSERPGSSGAGTAMNDTIGASLFIRFDDNASHKNWRLHDGETFTPDTTPVSRQDGWRFCVRCATLYLSYPGLANACPAPGGGLHQFNESGNYVLANNAVSPPGQAGWKQCHKCAGLFFPNSGSKCPVTTPTDAHDSTGSGAYSVIMNVPSDPGQHGWRYCGLCKGIYNSASSSSYCPGNPPAPFFNGPHSAGSTSDYSIEVSPQDVQKKWRKCKRCQALWLSSNGTGVCPAGGGHSAGGSDGYILVDDVSPLNGTSFVGWQNGFRYCKNCGVLWSSPGGFPTVCPATGSDHSLSGSGEYWVHQNNSVPPASPANDPGSLGWHLCSRCGVLVSQWSGSSVCAAGSGGHTASGTEFSLMNDYFLWHWCDKCQGLWCSNGNVNDTGACLGDPVNGHSQDASRDFYAVCNWDPAWPSTSAPTGYQNGWRRCSKCCLLYFGAATTQKCPKDNGAHSTGTPVLGDFGRGNFALRHNSSTQGTNTPGRQVGWRYCANCACLWMSLNSGSKCAGNSGGAHITTGSGFYTLDMDIV